MEEQVDTKSKHELEDQLRYALETKDRELKCIQQSNRDLEGQFTLMRSALEQKEKELQSVKQSKKDSEEQFMLTRSALEQREKELQSMKQRNQDMNTYYGQQLQNANFHLQQANKELESYKQRSSHVEHEVQNRVMQVENHWQRKLESILEHKSKEVEDLHHRMMMIEKGYQEKLQEKRTILHQKEEELKSFKDRVAAEVALSINTGKTESMNNPVGKFRLKEMYEDVRRKWPQIKNSLKSSQHTAASVQTLVQKIFEATSEKMDQKKKQIDEIFGVNEQSEPIPQRLQEYKLSTIQYLQLTVFHYRKDEAAAKTSFENPDDVMEYLVSQCTWLGSLMALNNPPLQPDWENHDPGMNAWDIFPRNITKSFSSAL